jgi:hypothetical protein
MLRENDLAAKLAGACTAGLIAALLTQPVDTAKTNVQVRSQFAAVRPLPLLLLTLLHYIYMCVPLLPHGKADLPGKSWPTARAALPRLYSENGLAGLYKV